MGVLPPGTTLPGLLVKETMIWLATAPRASGSGPAGPVLAGPLFHSREKKKKVPCRLRSVRLFGLAEKVIEVQY